MSVKQAKIPRRIHRWTALKLEYLNHYLQAYVTATKKQVGNTYYIDAFAGPGDCILIENNRPVDGSPWRALNARPPFGQYWFIEQAKEFAGYLRNKISSRGITNSEVLNGDCNEVISTEVLPRTSKSAPGFAFLDPTGVQLRWGTVVALAQHRTESRWKMELLVLYPYDMVINRWRSSPSIEKALNQFYPDDSWKAEFEESRQARETASQRRDRLVKFYMQGLRNLGYRYVQAYGPLKDRGRSLYNVIFAGDNAVGAKIMQAVWSKPRSIPGQLDYQPVRRPKR